MVDYKSYYKIIEYLDRNELEELKKYLEKEKEEYYLKNARENLTKYLKSKQPLVTYGFLSNGKLVIFNTISTYTFNEKTILTKERLERISLQVDISDKIEQLYNRTVNQPMMEVERIETEKIVSSSKDLIKLYANNNRIVQNFKKSNFDYAKYFLGDDIKYKVSTDESYPLCFASSDKGEGIIMGYKLK